MEGEGIAILLVIIYFVSISILFFITISRLSGVEQ